MKFAIVLVLLAPLAAHAQLCNPVCAGQPAACCAIPQSDLFAAYESDVHNGSIFRGITPNTAGAPCAVTTDVNVTTEIPINGPIGPVTVPLSPTISLMFNLGEGLERWLSAGGQFDGGTCFTPEVTGFRRPGVVLDVIDGCGDHKVTLQRPAFFCVTPFCTLVCFESKNVNGNNLPLPPGFDRMEDVCACVG